MEKESLKIEILKAFNYRHACKVFDTDKKISEDDFNLILESARLSPSSFGFEPWHFVVVQDKNTREVLKETAWGAQLKLDTASHFVLGLTMRAVNTRFDSPYIHSFMEEVQHLPKEVVEMKGDFFKKFQTDDFDLNDERSLKDWASKQTYIPLANMMTVAALLGIDSCPIEGFHASTVERILAEKLGLDMNLYSLSYMVAFGYRKDPQPVKTRRELDKVVSWI